MRPRWGVKGRTGFGRGERLYAPRGAAALAVGEWGPVTSTALRPTEPASGFRRHPPTVIYQRIGFEPVTDHVGVAEATDRPVTGAAPRCTFCRKSTREHLQNVHFEAKGLIRIGELRRLKTCPLRLRDHRLTAPSRACANCTPCPA